MSNSSIFTSPTTSNPKIVSEQGAIRSHQQSEYPDMSLSWTIGGFIEVPESLLYSSFTSSQLPKGSFPLPLTEGTYGFIDIYLWLCIKTQATIQAPSAPIEMYLLNISKSTLASPGFPPPQYPWVLFIEARISLCPSSLDSHSLSPVPPCSHYVLLSLLLKIALPVSHPFFFSLISPIYNKKPYPLPYHREAMSMAFLTAPPANGKLPQPLGPKFSTSKQSIMDFSYG